MAYAETKRNNVKYYGVSLSTWVENVDDSTARIHWSAAVDFVNWYWYGVRLHVKVGGDTPTPPAGTMTTESRSRLIPSPSRWAATGASDP